MKDITPRNFLGQAHGYWVYHWSVGNIMFKGKCFNDKTIGYWERYNSNGELECRKYYII